MIIIQDTREKEPWNFSSFSNCKGQIVSKVDAGDYIIQGKETLITIDRKKSPAELANNLGMYRERFANEMQRMQDFTHRYVICEFPYELLLMFPKGSGLPKQVQRKIRARGKFLASQVQRLSEEYDVKFLFCSNREEAQERAMELFQEAIENDE